MISFWILLVLGVALGTCAHLGGWWVYPAFFLGMFFWAQLTKERDS